jgi:hypothetical protein
VRVDDEEGEFGEGGGEVDEREVGARRGEEVEGVAGEGVGLALARFSEVS